MRFRAVAIAGFRQLVNVDVEFAEGLTVVAGDNEAGKSSLHDALVRGLYGFSKSDRRKSDGASTLDRCRPWRAGADGYGLRLEIAGARLGQDDVGRLDVRWRFDDHKVTVSHPDTGEDLTSRVCGKNQDVTLGFELLGLEVDDFLGICALRQAEIVAVGATPSLKETLQNAVAKRGGGNIDGTRARLVEAGRVLGLRAGTLNANPRGRLDALTKKRAVLEQSLADARARRAELDELAVRVSAAKKDATEAARATEELTAKLLRSRLAELQAKIERARALQGLASQPVGRIEFDAHSVAELRRLIDARNVELDALKQLDGDLSATQERVSTLRQRHAVLAIEIQKLVPFESLDASRLSEVTAIWHKLDAASSQPAPNLTASAPRSRTLLLAAAALVAAVSGAAALVSPAALAGLGLAVALVFVALRRRPSPSDPPKGASTTDLEARLAEALDAAGAQATTDVAQRAQAYVTGCERRNALMQARVETGDLDREIQELQAAAPERARRVAEIARLSQSVELHRTQLAIEATEPAAIVAAIDELEQRKRDADERERAVSGANQQLEALLAGRTLDALEQEVDAAERQLAATGGAEGEVGDVPALERELAAVSARKNESDVQYAQKAVELETREIDAPDPAEFEVEQAVVSTEIAAIEGYREALRLAFATLDVAATETFRIYAPALNAALIDQLPRITNHRYDEAIVRDDLSILVRAPETGEHVSVDELSRGTRDQIFLAQRLAIANLLDETGGQAPLLLDDPFAHFDATRLALGVELLAEISETRQVILFTEDERVVELAEAGGAQVTRLAASGRLTVT